jgi:hypothetical protein
MDPARTGSAVLAAPIFAQFMARSLGFRAASRDPFYLLLSLSRILFISNSFLYPESFSFNPECNEGSLQSAGTFFTSGAFERIP